MEKIPPIPVDLTDSPIKDSSILNPTPAPPSMISISESECSQNGSNNSKAEISKYETPIKAFVVDRTSYD